MDLFSKTGKMALGSRLRLIATTVTDNAAKIYELYNVDFSPKWFPVFFVLSENEEKTITEIAVEIGHSQPSVTKIIKEMTRAGLVQNNIQSQDKRRNVVKLTEKGLNLSTPIIKGICADVDVAIDGVIAEATHNLWEALDEWEFLLEQKSLFKRVQEQKKQRESKDVLLVPYASKYKTAFKTLNEEWISTWFELEEADRNALNNPEDYILKKGGKIMVALYQNEPVGVCALIKMDDPDYDFEMAKMAVSPLAQGKNIGYLLGLEIIKTAKEMGASRLYLESNTLLKPAINLYYKLGFQKIAGRSTPYKRANIQMALHLTTAN